MLAAGALIGAGASVSAKDKNGATPFSLAQRKGHAVLASALLDQAARTMPGPAVHAQHVNMPTVPEEWADEARPGNE